MTTTMKCRFAWRSGCVIENRATPRQGTLRRHDFDGACPESGVEQTPSDRRDRPIAGSECRFAASLLRSRSGSDPRPEGAHRVASIGQMQARRSSVGDRDLPLSILVARRRMALFADLAVGSPAVRFIEHVTRLSACTGGGHLPCDADASLLAMQRARV